ncbi:MAG: carboxypeptidase M32 [Anaerolineales bacterium]|nr:carboxypeptidase M32 [Anaerolineales bacterium]
MEEKYTELKAILAEVDDLQKASSILSWDQQANMPSGGAEARGYQLATISSIAHEKFTAEKVGKLIEDLEPWAAELDPDSNDVRLLKVTKRDYERSTRVPAAMVAEQAQLSAVAHEAWVEARQKADFSIFQPYLEKIVDWNRRYAALFAPYDHVYDPMLDVFEPGMKTVEVQAIFSAIRPKQAELIHAIAEKPQVEDAFLHQHFDKAKQMAFGREIVTALGYDWNRGAEGLVPHPFMTNLGFGDIRINNRVDEEFFNPYLFGAMHETGHALYEQSMGKELARTPLFGGASLGLHESQSRMYENLVGRSKPFWEHYYPRLQEYFASQLGNVSVDEFYKGINKVEPSFIRVEADEATYNMHIMLRLELEIALMDGSLEAKDVPEAWNSRMEEYLGITPPDDAEGCLQDVHWSMGLLGYFSTYALGNLISLQLWEKIEAENPNIYDQIGAGNLAPLLAWLKENVHKHGAKFEPQELVQMVTGSKIDGGPYLAYLNKKFGQIYNL